MLSGHTRKRALTNPSNINHELCHYTDDVTRKRALTNPSDIVNPKALLRWASLPRMVYL
jgi:hypothetical protein